MNLANAAPIVIVILFVILIDETHRSRSRSRCLTSAAFTSVILLLAGALGPATGDAEKRLVGYWPFEEREGLRVEDASGAGRHGEILNDSRGVQRVAGRNGGALQFAGGDPNARGAAGCLALPGLKEQDWSKGLTVELWARFTALDRPATYEMVSDTRDDRGPGFRFMVSWLSLWLRSGEGGGGKTWGAGTDANVTPLRPGEWYHLAGTYDGARFRVYVDGALAGESEEKHALTRGEGVLYVGAYHAGYAYGLNAVLDDLRLYNYARSPAEIMLDARLRD